MSLEFFNLLFEPGEQVCFSDNCTDTALSPAMPHKAQFFTINPLKDRRLAKNVTSFRNILVELDNLPLSQQEDTIFKAGLEPSSIVYSGGKSLHFIFSLKEPLASAQHYADAVARLYALLPAADPSCKDPARFSRCPGIVRADTERAQELIFLATGRISTADFLQRLPESPAAKVVSPTAEEKSGRALVSLEFLELTTCPDKYIGRVCSPGRNNYFHWLGCRLREAKLPQYRRRELIEQAWQNLQNQSDFPLREALLSARV